MAIPMIDLVDPSDPEEWYEKYWEYQKIVRRLTDWQQRLYTMRYEPDTWLGAWGSVVVVCAVPSVLGELGWLIGGGLAAGMTIAAGVYWALVWDRVPRIVRQYERALRDRRVLRVPKFLYDAVNRESHERYLDDWDEFEARRFVLLRETLNDAEPWLRQLQNDCGCKERCGHTNRLAGATRRQLRRRIRVTALRKVELMDAEHGAAIEMTVERNLQIRNQLRLTAEEDD